MKVKIFFSAILILLLFTFLPHNSIADVPNINYTESNSIVSITSNGSTTFLEVISNGIRYMLIFDGIQLIYYYPEG